MVYWKQAPVFQWDFDNSSLQTKSSKTSTLRGTYNWAWNLLADNFQSSFDISVGWRVFYFVVKTLKQKHWRQNKHLQNWKKHIVLYRVNCCLWKIQMISLRENRAKWVNEGMHWSHYDICWDHLAGSQAELDSSNLEHGSKSCVFFLGGSTWIITTTTPKFTFVLALNFISKVHFVHCKHA